MTRPNVKLRHLQQFLVVARRNSLTEVARERGTALPAVSRTIRELEQEVGARLFDRSRRATVLTPEGMTLQSYVQPAMRQIEEWIDRIAGQLGDTSLSMLVLLSANRELMPRAVALFRQQLPHWVSRYHDAHGFSASLYGTFAVRDAQRSSSVGKAVGDARASIAISTLAARAGANYPARV
jgi:DNA-binding transcriptional LysR family regulator